VLHKIPPELLPDAREEKGRRQFPFSYHFPFKCQNVHNNTWNSAELKGTIKEFHFTMQVKRKYQGLYLLLRNELTTEQLIMD